MLSLQGDGSIRGTDNPHHYQWLFKMTTTVIRKNSTVDTDFCAE